MVVDDLGFVAERCGPADLQLANGKREWRRTQLRPPPPAGPFNSVFDAEPGVEEPAIGMQGDFRRGVAARAPIRNRAGHLGLSHMACGSGPGVPVNVTD